MTIYCTHCNQLNQIAGWWDQRNKTSAGTSKLKQYHCVYCNTVLSMPVEQQQSDVVKNE